MKKIVEIGSNVVTADGDLELSLRTDDGSVDIECPADMLAPMVTLFSTALARSQDAIGVAGRKAVWQAEDIDFANYEDGSVGLSFRLPGGAEFAFAVRPEHLERIATALRAVVETTKNIPPPGSVRH